MSLAVTIRVKQCAIGRRVASTVDLQMTLRVRHPVIRVTEVELNNLVQAGRIKMPAAASDIPSVELPDVNIRINVRGDLTPKGKGNLADGIIGATAIERGSTLVSNDKALVNAVTKLGGKAKTP